MKAEEPEKNLKASHISNKIHERLRERHLEIIRENLEREESFGYLPRDEKALISFGIDPKKYSKDLEFGKTHGWIPTRSLKGVENKVPIVVFKSTVKEIIDAVANKEPIEGINLLEKIRDPSFRFQTEIDPNEGRMLSEAFANIILHGRSKAGKKGAEKGVETRNKKADTYAETMFTLITNLREEEGVTSIRKTVDLLNKKRIATPNGGDWRINTFQSLEKRWKELGLVPPPKP